MHIITKNLKTVLLITATLFVTGFSCNKEGSRPCTMVTPYSFTVTSNFTPQKEVYSVGDTIYLTSTFPKKMTNLVSNQQVDYSNNLGIGGNCNFGILDTINRSITEGLNKFIVFAINGSTRPISNSTNLGVSVFYKESASNYELSIGIRLMTKGLFSVVLTNLGSQGLKGKDCTNAGFNMTVTNTNKNLNLFEYALGYPPDALLAKNIFCFRVN